MTDPTLEALARPRWTGRPGRTEVWYLTATDEASGRGLWVHHETVAPTDGAAHAHGWTALFEPDDQPAVERFGPVPHAPGAGGPAWSRIGDCVLEPLAARPGGRVAGAAGRLAWDLTVQDDSPPLWTFPRTVWERELLPGAQVLPAPSARVVGTVTVDGDAMPFEGRGALARIYGHGSAQRWGWLHADLDGEGTLEIVTASARRPGLRRVPPMALLQLRRPGRADWPRRALFAAPLLRTRLHDEGFEVAGRAEGTRLAARVTIPADRAVTLEYRDPDGAVAWCTNSEVATAEITVTDHSGTTTWHLDRRAHAELGRR